MPKSIKNLEFVFEILKRSYEKSDSPSVTLIANRSKDPFKILISTLISLRTKDEVTLDASERLFARADTPKAMLNVTEDEIGKLIYPAGFYKTKAERIRAISRKIIDEYDGIVPDSINELLTFPGVGRKTANLVVALGYKIPAICVDTHVHRITNRFGWVKTKNPDQTEMALRKYLPVPYWQWINDYLVSYGQTVCKPISPFCSKCELQEVCPKTGVEKNR